MPKKLLLADDSVTIQKVIGISFANEDATLVTVDNGDDAIAKTRELVPDLVLADVVMPGKTGYEVCESIKADPNLRHIPVLLLTGTFEAFDEDRARRVGAAGHVAKPFEAQTLVDKVSQLLAASAAAPTAPTPAADEVEVPTALVEEAPDESFDFFSEDLSAGEPIAAAPLAETIVEPLDSAPSGDSLVADGEALDLGGPLDLATDLAPQDDAFTFGDEPFPDPAPISEPGPPAEPLPAAATANAESAGAVLPGSDAVAGVDAEMTFERGERPAAAVNEFTTELVEPDFTDSGDDLLAIDAEPISETRPEPGAATLLFDDDPGAASASETVDLAQATVLDPGNAAGFDISSADLDAPPEAVSVGAPPAPPAASIGAPPSGPAEPLARPDPTRAVVEAVAPKLREQLHDTLEKVAWESFGSLTEEIVRQAVERVETIAWEVVPKLAETLIQEEIRRMKGEDE